MIKGGAKERVLVAKDVLQWIKAEKFNVHNRMFCALHSEPITEPVGDDEDYPDGDVQLIDLARVQYLAERGRISDIFHLSSADLRDLIRSNVSQCSVCAKGAIFVTAIDRFDSVQVQDVIKSYQVDTGFGSNSIRLLDGLFTEKQLNLIELAFEGDVYIGDGGEGNSGAEKGKALAFHKRFKNKGPASLLGSIMRNLIKNNGTFKP